MHVRKDGGVTPEFGEFMVALATAWSIKLDEARIRIYAHALSDTPLNDLRRAATQAVRECRYFPTVAELRAFIAPSRDDAALIAWTALGKAAASAGAYASVAIDDGAAAEALEAVFGSWAAFCEMEDGPALGAKRNEFLAAYRAARLRPQVPRRLAGLLPPPPPEAATATWIARISGGTVEVVRDRPQLEGRRTRAELPEARAEE